MENNNWFTNALPYEAAGRHDGKFNVWRMTKVDFDGEIDLKWQVVAVFSTEDEAKDFISKTS